MATKRSTGGAAAWLKREKWSIVALAVLAALFAAACLWLPAESDGGDQPAEYVEYEKAVVISVLSDSTQTDPASDGAWRGEQTLLAEVKSGQYAGQTLMAYNYVGPVYGVPLKEGDGVSLTISTYANGDHTATVYEYNRIPALIAVVALFFLVTALVGRWTGVKSLLALVVTVLCLFRVLFPLLMRGASTLPAVFLVCAYIAAVSFTILGGVHRKSVCALLGTVAGTAIALLFGLLAQSLARVNGLRLADVQPLLQLRQTGTPLGLRGLLVAGIVVSALGAVMDVAMSISSALEEVHAANPALGPRDLFRSGMNIGRDMVGTMTNTLILAFLGSGFTLILYLYTLGLSRYQLLTSAYAATEIISGVASSVGMILAIPLTALISSALIGRQKK